MINSIWKARSERSYKQQLQFPLVHWLIRDWRLHDSIGEPVEMREVTPFPMCRLVAVHVQRVTVEPVTWETHNTVYAKPVTCPTCRHIWGEQVKAHPYSAI